jgi:hypothetical protein
VQTIQLLEIIQYQARVIMSKRGHPVLSCQVKSEEKVRLRNREQMPSISDAEKKETSIISRSEPKYNK